MTSSEQNKQTSTENFKLYVVVPKLSVEISILKVILIKNDEISL